MLNRLGDVTAILVGIVSVNPHANIFSNMHIYLSSLFTLSPTDTSEIIRMVVGLIIGLLSKFLYAIIDHKLKGRIKPIDDQEEILNLNIKSDEEENSK